jgi:alginate O-acetyltransferase complex protein AlgI
MVFNSLTYAFFLPVVVALYLLLPHRGQNRMLLAASYLFYGWWDVRFLFLIVVSTALDFCCGQMIDRGAISGRHRLGASIHVLGAALCFLLLDWKSFSLQAAPPFLAIDAGSAFATGIVGWPVVLGTAVVLLVANLLYPALRRLPEEGRRRLFLVLSVVGNLGILGFFKYFDFFVDSLEGIAAVFGVDKSFLRLDLVLPVGISFYTFQTMSYTIDVYRRQLASAQGYRDFALYVCYFPQLVAGPIERATQLLPRTQAARHIGWDDLSKGSSLIILGLFKKVAIADGVGPAVTSVFNAPGLPSWGVLAASSFLFSIQVYCDFAGYSDIARGSSRLLGIPLMVNFRLPLFAAGPAEFFQRWHISLSTWLRDYVYIPLGGSRNGRARMYRSLFLTMALGGLWHGAAWTFVIWGVYEGVLIVIDRHLLKGKDRPAETAPGLWGLVRRLPLIVGYSFVHLFSWMTFRSPDWQRFTELASVLFTGSGGSELALPRPTASALIGIPLLFLMEGIEYCTGKPAFDLRPSPIFKGLVYAPMVVLISMGLANVSKQFIYFQF